ncbi:MAG TPA: diacylglycerol kinase family protein [Gemmatimonadaceae bacterium]
MAVLTARAALLVNPASRRGADSEAAVRRAFAAAGLQPTVAYTRAAGDGERVARELAASHDQLFILGGDGTVMEAVTGLAAMGAALPIGILAAGTGNQLARALGISLSPPRAVAQLLRGTAHRMDVGVLNGHRRVGIGVGLGLDAAMIAGAHGILKERLGAASYVVSATAAASRPRRFGVRAVVDGRIIERQASVAMVLNLGRVFNELIEIAPGASLVDGQLDLVIVETRSLLDALNFSIFEMLLRRRHADHRWTFARGAAISIETAEDDVPAQVDGDLINARRLAMVIAPLGAQFLMPADSRLV